MQANMVASWSFFDKRELAAQAGTFLAAILLLLMLHGFAMQYEEETAEQPISLSIMPVEAAVEKSMPQKIQQVQPPSQERNEIAPEKADVPAPIPVQESKPAVPAVQQVADAAPVTPVVPKQISNSTAEAAFLKDVYTRLERKKIYPEAARDLGLEGEVEVEYELSRDGKLLRAEIAKSSGHKMLDQAALKTVRASEFRKFPDDGWLGMNSRVFRTKLTYSIND